MTIAWFPTLPRAFSAYAKFAAFDAVAGQPTAQVYHEEVDILRQLADKITREEVKDIYNSARS